MARSNRNPRPVLCQPNREVVTFWREALAAKTPEDAERAVLDGVRFASVRERVWTILANNEVRS